MSSKMWSPSTQLKVETIVLSTIHYPCFRVPRSLSTMGWPWLCRLGVWRGQIVVYALQWDRPNRVRRVKRWHWLSIRQQNNGTRPRLLAMFSRWLGLCHQWQWSEHARQGVHWASTRRVQLCQNLRSCRWLRIGVIPEDEQQVFLENNWRTSGRISVTVTQL